MPIGGWTGAILYGSDTLNTEAYPDKTTVEALATLSTALITISWVSPNPQLDGDEIEYSDGTLEGAKHFRTEYEFKVINKAFPSSNTTIESYFNTAVMTKKYKWIYLNTFPLLPSGVINALPTATVIPIAITGMQVNDNGGWKELAYSAKSRDKDV